MIQGMPTSKATKRAKPAARVRSYMTPAPRTIGPLRMLSEAHDLMRAHRIRHLPVLAGDKLVGIVSQRDLLLIESLPGVNPAEVPVEDAMTREVFVVDSATPLAKVTAEMADRRRGSAVVMHGDRVVGVFTVTDACRVLARLLAPAGADRPALVVPGDERQLLGHGGQRRRGDEAGRVAVRGSVAGQDRAELESVGGPRQGAGVRHRDVRLAFRVELDRHIVRRQLAEEHFDPDLDALLRLPGLEATETQRLPVLAQTVCPRVDRARGLGPVGGPR